MEINDIVSAIEARVELGRPKIQAQAIITEIASDLELTISCVVDPSLITYEMLTDIEMFNDEASNTISFMGGKLVNNGSDNALFILMFNVSKCNGGL